MIREQIEKAAQAEVEMLLFKEIKGEEINFEHDNYEAGREDAIAAYGNILFAKGAQWRINSVWHDREEQPEVGRWFIFKADDTNPFKKTTIKKIAYYTNRIENDKGLDWLKMVAEYRILYWAYIEDLDFMP